MIVSNPDFIECWLYARLIGFRQRYPDISLEIIPDDASEHHLRNRAVVAVHHGFAAPEAFESENLSTMTIFPVCSPKLIKGLHGLLEPGDLVHHMLLHESSTQSWTRWLVEVGCGESVNGRAGSVFHTSTLVMASTVAREGIGLAETA